MITKGVWGCKKPAYCKSLNLLQSQDHFCGSWIERDLDMKFKTWSSSPRKLRSCTIRIVDYMGCTIRLLSPHANGKICRMVFFFFLIPIMGSCIQVEGIVGWILISSAIRWPLLQREFPQSEQNFPNPATKGAAAFVSPSEHSVPPIRENRIHLFWVALSSSHDPTQSETRFFLSVSAIRLASLPTFMHTKEKD